MKRTNIHLTDEQRKWLRKRAEFLRIRPAAVVRRLIDNARKSDEAVSDWTNIMLKRIKGK